MSLRHFTFATVLAVILTPPALAADDPTDIVLNATGSTTFSRQVDGLFLDSFNLLSSGQTGTLTVTLTPLSGTVNFFAAMLGNESVGFTPEAGRNDFTFSASLTGQNNVMLQVFGFSGNAETLAAAAGSYQAVVSMQAVPELQTTLLMLLGLGAIAGLARRRRLQ
jgi:hypothetical protein